MVIAVVGDLLFPWSKEGLLSVAERKDIEAHFM